MNNVKKALGKRIRDLRKRKFLTQESLGYRTGICYKFIGEIERGKANPSLSFLKRLSEGLEIPLYELLSFPKETGADNSLRIRRSDKFEAFKNIFPLKDIKRERKIIKALKLLKSALR